MVLTELFHMGRLMDGLLQVPNLEVLVLVDGEELAVPGGELRAALPLDLVLLPRQHLLRKVQKAPFDLGDGELGRVVPHSQGKRVVLVVDPIYNKGKESTLWSHR